MNNNMELFLVNEFDTKEFFSLLEDVEDTEENLPIVVKRLKKFFLKKYVIITSKFSTKKIYGRITNVAFIFDGIYLEFDNKYEWLLNLKDDRIYYSTLKKELELIYNTL